MAPPQALGKYRIDKVLGRGAMGIVYQGFDPGISRRVAIKTLHPELAAETGVAERFRREAQAAGGLNHPNIVTIYEFAEDRGTPFIAMEFVDGVPLDALIARTGRLPLDRGLDIVGQILTGLDYCHARGVYHRDLKPANVILLDDGTVKIADFGIARVETSTLTQTGAVLGTPSYMSPEQFAGLHVDGRSDLFSAGVILYELLTAEKPFRGESMATVMHKVMYVRADDPTHLNAALPPSVDSFMRKALAKRPEARFQSAAEFSEALTLAASGRYEGAAPSDTEETLAMEGAPAARPRGADVEGGAGPRRRTALRAAVAGVALALAGGGAWWLGVGRPGLSQSGFVHVDTDPPGAAIWMGERLLGVTPHRFSLPAGEHRLVLKKDGYLPLSATLDVEPQADIDFVLPLTLRE